MFKIKVLEFLRESNAIEGVYDYDSLRQAKLAWDYLIEFDELSSEALNEAHGILMKNQKGLTLGEKGAFRPCGVTVGGRVCPDWGLVPALVDGWLSRTCQVEGFPHRDWEIKENHISFEKIHPWVDGNGRMGRILLNWQRLKSGLSVLVIKKVERWIYYEWFD